MFKWFWKFSSDGPQAAQALFTTPVPAGDHSSGPGCAGEVEARQPATPANAQKPGVFLGFDAIYQACLRLPSGTYGIRKVIDMIDSPHLAGMSIEAKRAALMMALEAAGVAADDILQDAMVRQRALKEYEEKEVARLAGFEAVKSRENSAIQADLDRYTAACMARIQGNLNEVAKYQDDLAAWQNRKQGEWRRIADAVALCTPPGPPSGGTHMATVMVRYESEPGVPARR